MATKGRLTMSGRREYVVEKRRIGYVAVCPCHLGYHFLMFTADGVVEGTVNGLDMPEDTRRQYETWRAFFAERDTKEA